VARVKVTVDLARCVGHGRCYELAPEIFGEDERGHCVPKRSDLTRELEPSARAAERNCPERAIRVGEPV
jgi:ferredoxin